MIPPHALVEVAALGAAERFQKETGGLPQASSGFSGFGGRHNVQEDEVEDRRTPNRSLGSGAAIAPPPSLTAPSSNSPPPSALVGKTPQAKGLGIAAKIMAKYGYKVRQGYI